MQSPSFAHHSTPVARAPWQDDIGQWHITRYEDAKQALSDPETRVALAWPRMMERAQAMWPDKFTDWPIILEIMNLSNNPWHSALRKATAGVIHRLGDALPTGQTAERALSACSAAPQDPVDAVSELLNPVLNSWLGRSMGFTTAQVMDLRISGRKLVNTLSTRFTQVTPTQLETLAADLVQRYSSAIGRDKPDWTLDDHARLFPTVVAPNAMDGLLTNIMEHLANNLDLQDQLRHCPRARRSYMFEAERYLVSLRYLYRKTGSSGLNLPSGPIPPSQEIVIDLASANRDPERWDDPHVFDPNRPEQTNMAFSYGIHRCLGVSVSRPIIPQFLCELLGAVRLAPGGTPTRDRNLSLELLTSLPLRLTPVSDTGCHS